MNVTRKTWVSAGIVGAILIGGMSVAAAASAGGIEKLEKVNEPPPIDPQGPGTPSVLNPPASQEAAPPSVVSKSVNPDPEKTARYWTRNRMEGAQPLSPPAMEGPVDATE
jgi:hypothetical protein